jgi:disulfide bond formation protein DsbB
MTDFRLKLLGATAGALVVAFQTFMLPLLPLGGVAVLLGASVGTVAVIVAVLAMGRGVYRAARAWSMDEDDDLIAY